jgi:hypothetical protein
MKYRESVSRILAYLPGYCCRILSELLVIGSPLCTEVVLIVLSVNAMRTLIRCMVAYPPFCIR